MDWYSLYVLAWRLSNTLDADFCVAALEESSSKRTEPQDPKGRQRLLRGEPPGPRVACALRGSHMQNPFNPYLPLLL